MMHVALLALSLAVLPERAMLPADELEVRSRVSPEKAVKIAEKALVEPIPDTSDELYGEFWSTGNRSHYQGRFFARLQNLDALALAEARERKGRFLPRIEDYLAAICDMKSWVLPAHDWSRGGKGTLRGEWISTDLVSTEVGAHLACVVQATDGLRPETVARIRREVERRVFAPVRREAPFVYFPDRAVAGIRVKHHWWLDCESNWNAVCWDNVVCAACGLVDDPADRAFFVTLADMANVHYLASFAADGYCSEGMGYWNYGFGHHLMMGRMLDRITGGKSDFFRRPKERLAAAYARAYTLREGASPAFADGNGAANSFYLEIVDEFWPDLPRGLPPSSEFPEGRVWLFRDPDGLSVAFKGGHNQELHNHNDVGSYYLMDKDRFVSGDPGGEEYTARTFSSHRYDSKVLSSYGHPVPVVGDKLQFEGRKAAAKVVEKKVEGVDGGGERSVVILDLTGAYEVKSLKKLTRTFVYDRPSKTFTVTDRVVFAEPTAFESPYNTYLKADNPSSSVKIGWNVRPEIAVKGGAYELVEEAVSNPGRLSPHRVAVRMKKPIIEAEVTFTYRSQK